MEGELPLPAGGAGRAGGARQGAGEADGRAGRKSWLLVPVPGSTEGAESLGALTGLEEAVAVGSREAGDPRQPWGHHRPGSAPLGGTVCSCSRPQLSPAPSARGGARGRSGRARPKEQTEQRAHENISLLFPPHHVLMADKTQSRQRAGQQTPRTTRQTPEECRGQHKHSFRHTQAGTCPQPWGVLEHGAPRASPATACPPQP